jgi:5-methyltetrahydropteroyltriglutamate--homocysteine methyltransferase
MEEHPRERLPHRAEHVGSLLRPRELKEAFRDHAEGRLDEEAFAAAQEQAIRGAIALQEEVGLRTITDGEFCRAAWSAGFVWALEGLEPRDSSFEFRDDSGDVVRWQTCYASRPVRRRRGITTDEYAFVRAATRFTPKVTMPAPSFLHFFRGAECADRSVYPDLGSFWSDVVDVYRQELAALAGLGATYVQLDEVPLAMLCDPDVRARVRARGEEPDALIDLYVNTVNRALEGRPRGMTVGMHLCRGNLRGHWMAAGGYEAIAERLFGGLAVDAFFLEYDSPRAGGFEPLRFMPRDKFVVLGLLSTKSPALEAKDDLRRRLDAASRLVPLERLALSPQCGFASTVGGNPLSIDDQRAKLGRVVEIAREVWGEA